MSKASFDRNITLAAIRCMSENLSDAQIEELWAWLMSQSQFSPTEKRRKYWREKQQEHRQRQPL